MKMMRLIFALLVFCLLGAHVQAQWVNLPNYEFVESSCIRYDTTEKVYQIDIACSESIEDVSIFLNKYNGNFEDGSILNFLEYYKGVKSLYFVFLKEDSINYHFDFSHLNQSLNVLSLMMYEYMFDVQVPVNMSFKNLPDSISALYLNMGHTKECNIDNWPIALKTLQLESNVKLVLNKEIPSDLESLTLGLYQTDISSLTLPKSLKFASIAALNFEPNRLNNIPTLETAEAYICHQNSYPDIRLDLKLPQLKSFRLFARDANDISKDIFGPNLHIESMPGTLQTLEIRGFDVDEVPIAEPLVDLALGFSKKDYTELINTLPDRMESLRLDSIQIGSIERFSAKLKHLELSKLDIVTLSELPKGLNNLWVGQLKKLRCLPNLPDSLRSLSYNTSIIKCIPNETFYIKANPNRVLCTDGQYVCETDKYTIVNGTVFLDLNFNGVKDAEDIPLVGSVLSLNDNGFAVSNKDGIFKMILREQGTFEIKAVSNHPYHLSTIPAIKTIVYDTNFVNDSIHFLMQFDNKNDVQVIGVNRVGRPGMHTAVAAFVENFGINNLSGVTVKIKIPIDWSVVAVFPSEYTTEEDTIIWQNVNLNRFSQSPFQVNTKLPATDSILGKPYQYEMWVESPDDVTPENNYYRITDTIIGSYDPNDKIVNHTSLTPENSNAQELIYTIRFQNTGTDTAFKVIVVDTIIGNLDPSSIRVLGASHDFTWEYTGRGIAAFTFDNILLPDSNVNEPASHGFVTLGVRANKDLAVGDSIYNRAGIYFDFNEPVITNKALTRIATVTSVYTHANSTLKIYPNPAKDRVRVEWTSSERATLRLLDISGKVIQTKILNQNFYDLDVNRLSKGMYLIQVQSAEGLSVGKLLIQ